MGLVCAGLSRVLGGINFLVTQLAHRVGGLSMLRVALFVTSLGVATFLLLLSLPVLRGGVGMLLLDRGLCSSFFDVEGGGDPVMFQHLFWFFGHPEVYALVLPVFGCCRHGVRFYGGCVVVFGFGGMFYALTGIGWLGCVV